MKNHLQQLIQTALQALDLTQPVQILVERTRDKQFGDLSSNIAMVLAKQAKCNPRELAEKIIERIPPSDHIAKLTVAGPGFINCYLTANVQYAVVSQVLADGATYGRSTMGAGKKVLLEFVSANPTGPLHVGHGRAVAFGASLADLLEAAGFSVDREYYVNDAGRQMNILAVSVWLRYLELFGERFTFPSNGYVGEYVIDIAKNLQNKVADAYCQSASAVFADIPADRTATEEEGVGDKEAHIDGLIARAKQLLGEEHYQTLFDLGLEAILSDIRQDLSEFGLEFQRWFSEKSLKDSGAIERAIHYLTEQGVTYQKDGALWFHTMPYGDDKDRVLVRDNGEKTYFASDVAYHHNKFERGYDIIIDLLGADHHGYVPRVKAAIQAMGDDLQKFQVKLVQFAILYRGKVRIPMTTRGGSFVTLRALREEVGNDATRFFYLMRKVEQHMDFDLALAVSSSSDNPVYYIQYAHARICSVFAQLEHKGGSWDKPQGLANLACLTDAHEQALMDDLVRYPEVIETAATQYEPHVLAHFLRDIAHHFHTYYNAQQFLVDDEIVRNARLALVSAVRQVIFNGLQVLGVSALKVM